MLRQPEMSKSKVQVNINFFINNQINIYGSGKVNDEKFSGFNSSTSTSTPMSPLIQETPRPRRKESFIYEERTDTKANDNMVEIFGYSMILGAAVFFILSIYAMIGMAVVGKTNYLLLDRISSDNYYCFLIPLAAPLTVIMTYLNWISIKFFRHS